MPSITGTITAKVQGQVAKVIGARETLTSLAGSSDINISVKATALLDTQTEIENRLTKASDIAKSIKAGDYSLSDITFLTLLAYDAENHLHNTQVLVDLTKDIPQSFSIFDLDSTSILVVIGAVAMAVWAFFPSKRKG